MVTAAMVSFTPAGRLFVLLCAGSRLWGSAVAQRAGSVVRSRVAAAEPGTQHHPSTTHTARGVKNAMSTRCRGAETFGWHVQRLTVGCWRQHACLLMVWLQAHSMMCDTDNCVHSSNSTRSRPLWMKSHHQQDPHSQRFQSAPRPDNVSASNASTHYHPCFPQQPHLNCLGHGGIRQ